MVAAIEGGAAAVAALLVVRTEALPCVSALAARIPRAAVRVPIGVRQTITQLLADAVATVIAGVATTTVAVLTEL